MSVWTWHCVPSLPERARPQGQAAALCSPPALLVGVGQKRGEMGSFRASCSGHRGGNEVGFPQASSLRPDKTGRAGSRSLGLRCRVAGLRATSVPTGQQLGAPPPSLPQSAAEGLQMDRGAAPFACVSQSPPPGPLASGSSVSCATLVPLCTLNSEGAATKGSSQGECPPAAGPVPAGSQQGGQWLPTESPFPDVFASSTCSQLLACTPH